MNEVPNEFVTRERRRQSTWKSTTSTLPEAARDPASYVKDGKTFGRPTAYCLPVEHAALNLLPEVRGALMTLFDDLDIPWHAELGGGPSNHLLDSQVQCANALGQMVGDPRRLARAFGSILDIGRVREVEDGRFLTFEFIGPTDYFGEGHGRPRRRGTHCTSVDAAFLYDTEDGTRELALVEWKYTERYLDAKDSQLSRRAPRYLADFQSPEGPLRSDIVDFELMLDEPFYQLMRQQLLAHRLEQDGALGASRVRVVHVVAPANAAYDRSIVRPSMAEQGPTVNIWASLLTRPDRFVRLEPAVFCDPCITSSEYVARYGDVAS